VTLDTSPYSPAGTTWMKEPYPLVAGTWQKEVSARPSFFRRQRLTFEASGHETGVDAIAVMPGA
jgi:hypothetical protein